MNFALALVSGLLLMALFPDWNAWFFAPFALTPLLLAAAREPSWKRRFLMGEAAGIVYWFGVCHWIQFVLTEHADMSVPLAWFSFALFCVLKALHMAVFTALAGWILNRRTWWTGLAVAALWTGLERTHGPFGFAWLTLGNAGVDMGVPMRLAPLVGVYGLSFAFAAMAAAFALIAVRRPRQHYAYLGALPLLYLLPALPAPAEGGHRAAAVQTNAPQSARWTYESVRELESKLGQASLGAALTGGPRRPEILLWPENPAPLYYDTDPRFRHAADSLASAIGIPFLFGSVGYTPDERPLNQAVLLGPDGKVQSRYNKMFLVPFGEFVPPIFFFVNRVTDQAGDTAPGTEVVVSKLGERSFGAFICYESAFPHLVREFTKGGAELLINLTNDGYFGKASARRQHLLLARMRAAENRRWVLRPTNDGITASIDPAGRMVAQFPEFRQMGGVLPFDWVSDVTPYTRYGDWFAWFCLAVGLMAAFQGSRR